MNNFFVIMKWGSLSVFFLITVGALGQEKVYVTGNGQVYSKKQWIVYGTHQGIG
jgi:hypothetical protein